MWDQASVLLDRAPFYAVARPLAGAAIGLGGGGLYGALAGALHAVLRGTPGLFFAWFLAAAGAGTVAGFIMGVCTVIDRAFCREPAAPCDPKPCPARAAPPRRRTPRFRGVARLPTRAG
jgi:hypothetical protein